MLKEIKNQKIARNTVLGGLFLSWVLIFLFSTMHLDLSRDVRQAFAIVQGTELPLNGQLLGGQFRLGPIWYYLLAALLWLLRDWLWMVMFLAAMAGSQVIFAYLLGKELQSRRAGIILAALVVLPSWGFYEQLFPTHVLFAPALTMAAMVAAIRYAKGGKEKYLLLQGLAFSLAIHAHPTVLVALPALLYFNFKGFFAFGCSFAALVMALFFFLLPFVPMIVYQLKSDAFVVGQFFSYAGSATEAKDWSKIYSLPFSVGGGLFYLSTVLPWGELLLWSVGFVAAVFAWAVFADKNKCAANAKKMLVNGKAWLIFGVLLLAQSAILVLLSSGHAYYYTATLRIFLFTCLAVALAKILADTNTEKCFIAALAVATLFCNALLFYGAAQWAGQGALPLNFFPLADVSAKPSEKIWLPAISSFHEAEVQRWLCTAPYHSLHGSLASHLIYNYSIEAKFGCPEKKMAVGKNSAHTNFSMSYLALPKKTGEKIEKKDSFQVGSMRIYPMLKVLGPASIPDPSVGIYPPALAAAKAGEGVNIVVSVNLNQGDVLAVTDLSQDYLKTFKVSVQEDKGGEIIPLVLDMQTRIYQCPQCGVWKLKVIFDASMKDRLDMVVF